MAEPRNLPLERRNERRKRAGMAQYQAPDPSQQDITQSALNWISLSQIPFVSDVAGLAADARMYQMEPDSRNALNYGMTMLGVLPFVPAASLLTRKATPNANQRLVDKGLSGVIENKIDAGQSEFGIQDSKNMTRGMMSTRLETDPAGGRYLVSEDTWVDPMFQRQGVATGMYDAVENMKNMQFVPDRVLTQDGANFWASRNPELVKELLQAGWFSDDSVEEFVANALKAVSDSEQGTGVAAASALTGDYRDRIIQEYPKSYKPAIIENYVSQGVDPRTFAAGAGDNVGDPRMGQLNILGGTTVNIGDQRIGDVPRINLADYEGYPFLTSMADRAAAGDVILDINGVPINVSRRGGQNYMLDPESGEFVWASDEDVVLKSKGGELSDTSFFKTAKDLKEKYGKDPLIVPWTMAPTGIDFSTQIGETMLSYARNSISRGDLASLDKDVKKIIPDWPGIDNPEWVASFRNTTGNQRKAVENLLDRNYVDKGGITSGIARYANIDSDLRMARDGQLVNAGIVDTGRYPLTDSILVHPTYNTGLYGEGLGRIAGDIQVFELLPDARALMGIIDPLNPPRNALRALEMKPYGGVITESALRAIEDRRR